MARIGVRRAAWIGSALALAIAAGSIGFVAGRSQQIRAMIQMLQVEAAGNLTQRVEVLSLLRMGDVSGAITHLESEADVLTVNMAGNRGADRQALAYMKTYLAVVPPSPARAQQLSPALEGVPTLKLEQCRTALKALLASDCGWRCRTTQVKMAAFRWR